MVAPTNQTPVIQLGEFALDFVSEALGHPTDPSSCIAGIEINPNTSPPTIDCVTKTQVGLVATGPILVGAVLAIARKHQKSK